MALIQDPDSLNQGTEIIIDPATKTITLNLAGNLSTDGVTGLCLYSFFKEEWKDDTTLIKYDFPMVSITNEQFEFVKGWKPADDATRKLIRTAGWAEVDGTVNREYAGIVSLGNLGGTDQPYFQQESTGAPVNTTYTGPVNEAVQIYGDAANGDFDYRSYFKLFVREQGKKYALSQISDIGVSEMTYIVYRFPLSNETDLKISETDVNIGANAPYTGINITYYGTDQTRDIGGTSRNFDIIIEGNNATAEEIYEKVQYLLRQNSDIDEGTGTIIGQTAEDLLTFVGDTLITAEGVFIDNFQASDTNRLEFTDTSATKRTFPFVASLTINFNDNLVSDADAIYKVFFSNDNAGDDLGYDFGTDNAIIVNDNLAAPMSGSVSGQTSIQLSFDYDNNVQRGAASAGVDAPITVVAIGLQTGQYVKSEGTISKSTANSISMVASLERNYLNPV